MLEKVTMTASVPVNQRKSFQTSVLSLTLANIAIVIALCIGGGYFIYSDYNNRMHTAEQQAIDATNRYHDNAWLIMSSIESALHATIERLADNPEPDTLNEFLAQTSSSFTFVRTIIVVRPNGDVIADSRPDAPAVGVNIADREYIIKQVDGLVDGIDIDFPVESRIDGAWSTPVTLAAYDDNENLQWIVVAAFDPVHFAGLFLPDKVDQVDHSFIVNDRGDILGTIPFNADLLNTSLSDTEFFQKHFSTHERGYYQGKSILEDGQSIIAYRTAQTYPLHIVTQVSLSTVMEPMYRDTAITILVILGLALITTTLTRYQVRQVRFIEQQSVTLKNSEERFQTLFSVAPIGIALCEANIFVNVNTHFQQILSYSATDMIGQSVQTLDIDGSLADQLKNTEAGEGFFYNLEFQVKNRNGQTIPILVSAHRIQLNNKVLMLVAFSDISDRIEAEKAQQIAQTLQAQLAQEQEFHQFKTHLISMIAHDLRNPMAVIMTSASLLKKFIGNLSQEKIIERLEKILGQVTTLNRMIDEISALRDHEVVLTEPQFEVIRFEPMLESLIENLQTSTNNKCEITCTHTGHATCYLDRTMLQKILMNLLTNAIKYSPTAGKIQLTSRSDDEQLTITVADNGIGIPADDQPRLFDMFYRASNVGKVFGTGIGLAIIKQTVDQLNGAVTFQSEENVGTSFTVILPQLAPSAES